MNRTHIFTIEDSFYIEKRGVVIVGNILDSKITLIPKQKLHFEFPNGEIHSTEIIGVDFFTKCFTDNQAIGVLVNIQNIEQVPLGTKVYV